jgi:hypothetical protein
MGLSDIRISDREGSYSFWAFFQRCTELRACTLRARLAFASRSQGGRRGFANGAHAEFGHHERDEQVAPTHRLATAPPPLLPPPPRSLTV